MVLIKPADASPGPAPTASVRYAAFVSYSRAVDEKLASAVCDALERFAKPWYWLRAVRIFRDDSSLSASPQLWGSIESALDESEFFILLASPEAAASKWVARELEHWMAAHGTSQILIALTDGEITWDLEANDFDSERSSAIPPVLRGRFIDEPRWVDLRGARADHLSLLAPLFRDKVADLAAPLHHQPKDDLVGTAIARHRTTRRLVAAVVVALVLLSTAAAGAAVVAVNRARDAELANLLGTSRRLAAQAVATRDTRLDTAMLLAVAAYRTSSTPEAARAMLDLRAVGAPTQRHLDGEEQALSVAIDPTGKLVATSGDGRATSGSGTSTTIVVRELATGAERGRIPDADEVLGFVPGGVIDEFGRVHDTTNGALVRTIDMTDPGTGRLATPDAISSDGTTMVAISELDAGSWPGGPALLVWDTSGRAPVRVEHPGPANIAATAVSRDGHFLVVVGTDGTVRLRDTAASVDWRTVAAARRPGSPAATVDAVAVTADGSTVAIDSGNGRGIRLFETATGFASGELAGSVASRSSSPVSDGLGGTLAFSDDDQVLVQGSPSGALGVWDVPTREPLADPLAAGPTPVRAAISGDHRLVVTANGGPRVTVWDLADRPGLATIVRQGERRTRFVENTAAIAPGGDFLAVRSGNSTVEVVDGRDRRTVATVASPGGRPVTAVGISPDGSLLAMADDRAAVRIVDRAGAVMGEMRDLEDRPELGVLWLRFGSNGRHLGIGFALDAIRGMQLVYAVPDARGVWVSRPRDHAITQAQAGFALHSGRDLAAASLTQGLVEVSSTAGSSDAGDRLVQTIRLDSDMATALAFTPDGAGLVTGDPFGDVALWDLGTGQRMRTFVGARGFVTAAAVSPDGQLLAVGTSAGQVAIWELATGRPTAPLLAGAGLIRDLQWQTDGTLLGEDGTERITAWDLGIASAAAALCQQAGRNPTAEEQELFTLGGTDEQVCPQWP
jgi:WD40 repeat protein